MTISKRKLTKWRKEALKKMAGFDIKKPVTPQINSSVLRTDQILQMTQELLDQHLLEEIKNE